MMKVLLVEDNLEHAKLIQLLLKRKKIRADVFVARDGVEALEYLQPTRTSPALNQARRPDVILLDLNAPRIDGREVLRRVKSTESLRDIPIVVVSTSDKPEDRIFASHAGAAEYICKSTGFEEWGEMLSRLTRYLSHQK